MDRLRRICERLTCVGASVVANGTDHEGGKASCPPGCPGPRTSCPPGCPAPRITWKQTPSSAYVQTLGRDAQPSVDASVFVPARGGAWLAPLECRGPNAALRRAAGAAQPFPNAAHIRSIRYDFERPPETVAADMVNRTHDSPTAGLAENSAAG